MKDSINLLARTKSLLRRSVLVISGALALLLFFPNWAVSQTWAKSIDLNNNDRVYDGIPLNDGYILTGYTGYDGTVNGISETTELLLLKLDQYGAVEWARNPLDTLHGEGRSIIINDKGNFVIGATLLPEKFRGRPIIMEVDRSGELVWISQLGVSEDKNGEVKDIVQTEDGYFVTGWVSRKTWNIGDSEILAAHISLDGDVLWSRQIGEETRLEIGQVAATMGDTLAICANIPYNVDNQIKEGVVVYLLDLEGNDLTNFAYGDSSTTYRPRSMILRTGNIKISGSFGQNFGGGFVLRFGMNGTVDWYREVNDEGAHRALDGRISQLDNGAVLFAASNGQQPFFVQLEDDGNISWQKRLDSTLIFHALFQPYRTADGGYFIAGRKLDSDNEDILCLRVDAQGCITTSIPSLQDAITVKVYPNPTSDKVSVEFVADQSAAGLIHFFDLSGRLVHSVQIKSSITTISTSGFSMGAVYWTLVSNEGRIRATGSFVVHRS